MKRFAHFIAYHPKTVVIVALLLLIPAVLGYIGTYVNYDILSYLPEELDSVQGEIELDKTFNSAAMSFLVVENMPAKDVKALKEKIAEVKNVSDVIWVDDIADISIPEAALPDVIRTVFYNKDSSCTLILVRYKYDAMSDETMEAIEDIRSLMNEQCFISGMSVILKDTRDMTDSQAPIFVAIAIASALVVMSICMESWIQPLVLLAALGIAVIYNMGTNIFFGQISYITQSIAAILQLGVTMDYSVFLIDRFNEEKLRCTDKREAMENAIQAAFSSLAGSSLTTVFGFLALCFMQLSLGLDIGLVMAKGVVLGVVTVVIVLPAFVIQLDKPLTKYSHKSLIPSFNRLNGAILKKRPVFAVIFIVLLIPSFFLQSKVDVYYSMDKMLPADTPCIEGLNKVKDEFNMATSHFIIVDDSVEASKLARMESEIEKLDGISSVLAYNKFVGSGIPDSMIPDSLKTLVKAGGKQMILANSSYTSATDECNAQLDKLESIVKSYDSSGVITGEGALYKDLITITDHDFKLTNILSIISIFILIAIVFKSISIPVILIASIELAIFINEALCVVTGTEISFIAPTVISCVQLGATVDYAILMSTRFREEIQKGHDRKKAMHIAANSADKSIIQSALVFFAATFGVYLTCDINIVKELCSLLARGSLISAAIIILLLPPIMSLLEGVINKTTYNFRGTKIPKKKKNIKTGEAAQ